MRNKVVQNINVFLLVVVVMFCTGCNEDSDYYLGINHPPMIRLNNGQDQYTLYDTIKVNNTFSIGYTFYDGDYDGFPKPELKIVSGPGDAIFEVKPNNLLEITPGSDGDYIINVGVTDNYGVKDSSLLFLNVYKNLPPVAHLIYYPGPSDNITFDASGSYDRDQEYGGYLVDYEYYFGEVKIEFERNYIYVHKNALKDGVMLKVRAKDNEGAWSGFYQVVYHE